MEELPDIGSQLGLGGTDLIQVALRAVQALLGFAPLLSVVMLIFGGFMWMTSGGDEERLEQAKKTVSGAVVGFVVVMLAWAAVSFVMKTTLNVSAESLPQ